MMNEAIKELKKKRAELQQQLKAIDAALEALDAPKEAARSTRCRHPPPSAEGEGTCADRVRAALTTQWQSADEIYRKLGVTGRVPHEISSTLSRLVGNGEAKRRGIKRHYEYRLEYNARVVRRRRSRSPKPANGGSDDALRTLADVSAKHGPPRPPGTE
ncbi:MAG: hypothetical protein GWO02_01280 [Gammaproteobacteria bacterium]|nr:hypothetical protein [Gammaproteobacteria bacterium]